MKHLILALVLSATSCASTAPVVVATPVVVANPTTNVATEFRPEAEQLHFAYMIGTAMGKAVKFPKPELVGGFARDFAQVVVKRAPSDPIDAAGAAGYAACIMLEVPKPIRHHLAESAVAVVRETLQRDVPAGMRADVAAVAIAVSHVALTVAAVNQSPKTVVKEARR